MSWWVRQQFGGILLICLVSVDEVRSFSNDTIIQQIPETYANISGGNVLLTSLMRDCRNPTFSCIQNTMYRYLDGVLDRTDNCEVGGFLSFMKNNVSYDEIRQTNEIDEDDEDTARSSINRSPLEEVADSLRNKGFKFMLTHNMQMQMPDTLFDGAVLQVSPRHFEDNGLVAKLEFIPNRSDTVGTPRILFKKISKVIGEKLMNALLAILLVLSMASVKFMFFMPMLMGVAAAKKLLLKLLLFIFPFLSHLFKLCPFYEPHSPTKFHHHHHQIAHLHHVAPHIKHHPEIVYDHPPHHHHHDDHHSHYDIGPDYYSEGPELTNDFITHRKTEAKPSQSGEENDILSSWFGGQSKETVKHPRKPQMNRPLTPTEIENLALKAEKEAVLKVRLQQEHQRVLAENKLLQEQIKQGLKLQDKLRLQASIMQQKKRGESLHLTPTLGVLKGTLPKPPSQVLQTPPINQALPFKAPQINKAALTLHPLQSSLQSTIVSKVPIKNLQVNKILTIQNRQDALPESQTEKQPFSAGLQQALVADAYDSFYSPILEKIDKVLVEIGFTEEVCKERLICSMYKNPTKFSPHSNLVSTQLSRDASELQKPTATNTAVVRFYRYVQAARDGQDKRECLRLYPSCSINTEL